MSHFGNLYFIYIWSFFVTRPSAQAASFLQWNKLDTWQEVLYNGEADSFYKAGLWTRVGAPGLWRCFQLVHGHLDCGCECVCTSIYVAVHVCASASHCWGPYLSWHGNYVCIFLFPALLVCHQTCPDSCCPPGRLAPPPPTLCPMPPRYAPDASQLVCRLCSAGRLLETDARATVGPCLRICVRGQPWALTVTFTAGRDSGKELGVSAARSSFEMLTVSVLLSVPVFATSSVWAMNCNSQINNSSDISGDLAQLFLENNPQYLKVKHWTHVPKHPFHPDLYSCIDVDCM